MKYLKSVLLGLLILVAVGTFGAAVGFRFWLKRYLASDAARERLNAAVSAAMGTKGEFTALQPQSLESIYSDGFTARDGAAFGLLKADQLRAEVRFGFLAKSCTVENLDVTRLRLVLPGRGWDLAPVVPAVPAVSQEAAAASSSSSSGFELRRVTIADFEADWGGGELRKTRLVLTPSPGNLAEWLLRGEGGTARFSTGNGWDLTWRVEEFDARNRNGVFYLSRARLRLGGNTESGALSLEGEFGPRGSQQCLAKYTAIPVAHLLPSDWRARLTGKLSGSLDLKLENGAAEIVKGDVNLAEGELSALPFLDKVAELTRTDGFRRMNLHKGRARLSGSPSGTLRVEELLVESTGLLKLEGAFTVRAGQIDGTVQLGVIPAALERIPGAREKVFTASRDGYVWTPVRLSGLAAHPAEDLSSRLAAAALEQSVNTARDSIKENAREVLKVMEAVKPMLPVKLPSIPLLE